MTTAKSRSILLLSLLGFLGTTVHAGQWNKTHPRRTEVNKRLKNQNARINQGLKNHKLTYQEASKLKREDRNIRREERTMASANGGHITRAEQRALNQQENHVSHQIYNEKHGQ